MKIAQLKVVSSRSRIGMMSLRGPKGQGHNDSVHPHVTKAKFEDGDEVALLSREELLSLATNAKLVLDTLDGCQLDKAEMEAACTLRDMIGELEEL